MQESYHSREPFDEFYPYPTVLACLCMTHVQPSTGDGPTSRGRVGQAGFLLATLYGACYIPPTLCLYREERPVRLVDLRYESNDGARRPWSIMPVYVAGSPGLWGRGGGALLVAYRVQIRHDRTLARVHGTSEAAFLRLKEHGHGIRKHGKNPEIYWSQSPRGEKQGSAFLVHASGNPAREYAGFREALHSQP